MTCPPESEQQLEEFLSRPSDADIAAVAKIRGTVVLLGAGGKMGPSLAVRTRRAAELAGADLRVVAVSRFSDPRAVRELERNGVETHAADLLDAAQVAALPDSGNVLFLAGRKFGSTGAERLTWAMNALVPVRVAERYRDARIVALSSGNVYPLTAPAAAATEETPPGPIGEYAQSVLARERLFEYFSVLNGTPVTLLRLNYAVELRYGVLLEIGRKVLAGVPVDLTMGAVNVIWQGDANSVCLRSLALASTPPLILNLTGPETLSVRRVAEQFGALLGKEPVFRGQEAATALLNNAGRCHRLLGYPSVSATTVIEWLAHWLRIDGPTFNKPTHFETRDGRF